MALWPKLCKMPELKVVLLEPGPDGVRNARRRGVRQVLRGTLEAAGFLPDSIPSAGLFDVLEHIEDDRQRPAPVPGRHDRRGYTSHRPRYDRG